MPIALEYLVQHNNFNVQLNQNAVKHASGRLNCINMHLIVKQQFLVGKKTEGIESVYLTSCFEKKVYITKFITDGLACCLIYLNEKLNVINFETHLLT